MRRCFDFIVLILVLGCTGCGTTVSVPTSSSTGANATASSGAPASSSQAPVTQAGGSPTASGATGATEITAVPGGSAGATGTTGATTGGTEVTETSGATGSVASTGNTSATGGGHGLSGITGEPGTTAGSTVASTVAASSVPASSAASARLLDQATFGPTASDIAAVQGQGLSNWINQQLALPATYLPAIPDPLPPQYVAEDASLSQDSTWGSEWWGAALTAPDQLRQRVAFALSHVYVISNDSLGGRATTFYYNLLVKNAFGNWRQLMEDVTLSPGMGDFLNMANSGKAPAGQIANENFARENMQLFSLGPNLLNPDGSLQTDASGNSLPTFTQAQVQAFARAFTGWTYVPGPGQPPLSFPVYQGRMDLPMAAVEEQHDTSAKGLLNGTVLPAGQTAQEDVDAALDNIFAHPNLPPFVSRQLIQHLVTSQPSPAYVARVTAVFIDNGAGVRGDMKAVLRAILLDPEARAGDTDPEFDGGHLREPLLYGASVLRAIGLTPTPADPTEPWPYTLLLWQANTMGQFPMNAPSVFGFFPPGYVIPQTTMNAPEFGIENTASVAARMSFADTVVSNGLWQISLHLGASSPLGLASAKSPEALVDLLGSMFLHGQMPAAMRTSLLSAVAPISDVQQRLQFALYLVITSAQYKICH